MRYRILFLMVGGFLSLFILHNITVAVEIYDMAKIPQSNSSGLLNFTGMNHTRSVWSQINISNITYNYTNVSFEAHDYRIHLQRGIISPESNTNNITTLKEIVPSDIEYYLIQVYDNSLPKEEYNEMLQDNITFLNYIANDTYIAKIPQDVIENKTYTSLRWVGFLNYSQKIDVSLENLTGLTNSTRVKL